MKFKITLKNKRKQESCRHCHDSGRCPTCARCATPGCTDCNYTGECPHCAGRKQNGGK